MNELEESDAPKMNYVLVTAAYNEEKYIEATIKSVVSQTVCPSKWVIVSDGSIDRTDEIVLSYAAKYPFIELLKITEDHPRDFAAQVNAINSGVARLQEQEYTFLGNIDSDVSFGPRYFEQLLAKFAADPQLGLGGGFIHEEVDGVFESRANNSEQSVAHAVQLFRREAFASVGGYVPLKYGGPDWYAEILVRMAGWKVESFRDLPVNHHRPTGTAGGFRGLMRYWYRQGLMDHGFGTHPLFQVIKMSRRWRANPMFLGAFTRLLSYTLATLVGRRRLVPDKVVKYLRAEQKQRMLVMFRLLKESPTPVQDASEPAR